MERNEILPKLNIAGCNLFDRYSGDVSGERAYVGYFGEIPSEKSMQRINHLKAKKWIEKSQFSKILNRHVRETTRHYRQAKVSCANAMYVLEDNILVTINHFGEARVLHNQDSENRAEEIIMELMKFKMRGKRTTDIGFVARGNNGLRITESKISKPKLKIDTHYNDDLAVLHKDILKHLRKKNKNGLILFYGEPGTGKSTYIRYLIHCQNKRVIFLPTGLARNLESPDLIALLLDNRNSILVIEDAEDLLTSREVNLNSGISMLLNLTDGLMGESLGIQVISTFNTQLANIDNALLRKGRLLAMYEFKPLAAEKAKNLLHNLNPCNGQSLKPAMTLAEIYNAQQEGFKFKKSGKPKIGFAAKTEADL